MTEEAIKPTCPKCGGRASMPTRMGMLFLGKCDACNLTFSLLRKGMYASAEEQMRDVVTAQGRAPSRLVMIDRDAAVPVGEPIPGISPESQSAAAARLAIDKAMTKWDGKRGTP